MAVNKVEVNGETKLDLTQDTVTPENLLSGATAHNAAGEQISGAVAPVRYDVAQNLTSEQQKQARDNIGAGNMLKSVYDPQGKNQDAFQYADDAIRDIPSQDGELVELDLSEYATTMRKVTLEVANWNSSTMQQAVTCAGVLADGTKQKVICSPVDESYDSAWNTCYVQCVGHGADSLTFQCGEIPAVAVEVFVTIEPVAFVS